MDIENLNVRKYFLFFLIFIGVVFALFSLRYFIYLAYPKLLSPFFIQEYYVNFYFKSFLNSTFFISHIVSGTIVFCIAPILFISVKRQWESRKIIMKLYLYFSFILLFWPVYFYIWHPVYYMKDILTLTIVLLAAYTLFRAWRAYSQYKISTTIIYITYHFCIILSAALFRPLNLIFYLVCKPMPIDPNYLHIKTFYSDLSMFLSLILGVLFAKIVIRTHAVRASLKDS